jgi:hypothetical protein
MAVTGFEIERRETVLGGQSFGNVGPYERVVGILRFAVDPERPAHRAIVDLGMVPRNAAGAVEFWADAYVLQPVAAARGNRRLLLDVPNRGRKIALGMFNGTAGVPEPVEGEHFGNGFLMRQGYTLAWVGWQPDVPRRDGLMALAPPKALGVSGRVRCEWRPNLPGDVLPLADRYHIPYAAADLDDPDAHLSVRESADAAPVAVPRHAWRFARREGQGLVPDPSHIHLSGGFAPGKIYDLVYRSQDPPLVGLGFLAVRDTAAFLRWGGTAAGNPAAGRLDRAYAFGVSQSGRFLRHLLYLGLTEDEEQRKAFDAIVVHVAGARRGEFNMRFGQPSLNAVESVGSLFPFADDDQTDPVSGACDGLLRRLTARGRLPRIFTINTSAEYWRGDGSLVHTDVEGRRDVEPPAAARAYLFAGSQHVPGAVPPLDADPNTGARGLQMFSTLTYAPLLRAALVNLDRWVSEDVEPPPSAFPRLADGTAVTAESTAATFAAIPGVRFPDRIVRPARLDFGPDLESKGIASELPPKVGARYPSFVSAVDRDGNEVAGLRPPELLAPLATFTGWNLRHPDQGAPGDLMSMVGSTVPFPRTRDERERTRDPRPSIQERYGDRAGYLARMRESLGPAVAARHILAEDVDAIVERAGQLWDFLHSRH